MISLYHIKKIKNNFNANIANLICLKLLLNENIFPVFKTYLLSKQFYTFHYLNILPFAFLTSFFKTSFAKQLFVDLFVFLLCPYESSNSNPPSY